VKEWRFRWQVSGDFRRRGIVAEAKNRAVYQLKVSLAEVSPPIWRRIQVWEDCTLHQLHRVLQAVMRWENYHLYEFVVGTRKYRDPHPENERKILDSRRTRVAMVLPRVGAKIDYVYDFGDEWRHELLLEAIVLPEHDAIYPRCIAGERSGPPEDAGGPWGYKGYLQAMADPRHVRHAEMMGWRGPFDPEAFSIENVNCKLEREFRVTRKRTSPERVGGKVELPSDEAFEEAERALEELVARADGRREKPVGLNHRRDSAELSGRKREFQSHTPARGGTHMGKRRTWVDKETRRGFRGHPVATMAFYGPTADTATKIVVAIVREEGSEPDPLERWFSEEIDVRSNPEIGKKVIAFLKEYDVKSVVATDGLIGCPHEEGIDYPEGKSCPKCPYWAGRDRFTRERIQ
jgi:hypothetical protein